MPRNVYEYDDPFQNETRAQESIGRYFWRLLFIAVLVTLAVMVGLYRFADLVEQKSIVPSDEDVLVIIDEDNRGDK